MKKPDNRAKENENQQDEKEIENYKPHNYFIDILNSVNVDNIQTKIGHYQYLLLALLTYQPPLRTNFYVSAKIIRSMKKIIKQIILFGYLGKSQ